MLLPENESVLPAEILRVPVKLIMELVAEMEARGASVMLADDMLTVELLRVIAPALLMFPDKLTVEPPLTAMVFASFGLGAIPLVGLSE